MVAKLIYIIHCLFRSSYFLIFLILLRKNKSIGGGSIFIAVISRHAACVWRTLAGCDTDGDFIWIRLQLLRESFHCSYYRPPSAGTQSITESLSLQLYNRNVSPDLTLAGNFNYQIAIGWEDGCSNPQK